MPKFRKKPVVIEAVQFTGSNTQELVDWIDKKYLPCGDDVEVLIETLEGLMRAKPGDYIIKGVNGEFYPCKPDIFEKTYEAVE
jgi:hypothetical protein